jgi:Copper type II ascorbate-dependent monooxygenase, C-terminal domain
MRRFACALLLVAGCHSSSSTSTSSELTYWKSVKPIADAKCVGCHTANNIAPFTLESFADFKAETDKVRVAVANKVMPPWPPGSGCADYQDDRSLSDAEIATITGWIDQGAVEGKQSDYKPGTPASAGLSRVDRTLQLAAPYQPTLTPDEYRCFLMDWPETTDKYISGFRANPGNAPIVHHVIAFLAAPADVATYQALDDADPAPGYVCFGGPGGPNGGAGAHWLGAWAPGSRGDDFPTGTGLKVPAGSKVIVQVHYNMTNDNGLPDQTSVDFKLDDSVQKEAIIQPWTNPQWVQNHTMVIPAGTADQMYAFQFAPAQYFGYITNNVIPSGVPVTMWTGSLHMHTRGRKATLAIVHADGTRECMLDIPKWDFHWQGAYAFTQPKTFAPTDQLYLECHFDNSDSTMDRNWGEGTADEMCLGGFYVTP